MKRMGNLKKEIKRLLLKIKRMFDKKDLILLLLIIIFSQYFLPWLLVNIGSITKPNMHEDFTTFILYRIFFFVIIKIFVKILRKILKKYLK
jgi:uncharacterized membrane protein